MTNRIVVVPTPTLPIKASPGFSKKQLSDYKLDLCGLCAFGCQYCSSTHGNYLRIRRKKFANQTQLQLGERVLPQDDPSLMFAWPDVLGNLEQQLQDAPAGWGEGYTLVFSMLTDGFSPPLVADGTTRRAFELVLRYTLFRIRILTKNAVVGSPEWVQFFSAHRERFVVGLSIGTLDDTWAERVEIGTSPPSERMRALQNLQSAEVPTFGMLCPIMPDGVARLDDLLDGISPNKCESIWVEPYNNRVNWQAVRDAYPEDSRHRGWFTRVYEQHDWAAWSEYATGLYFRLRIRARDEGWLSKLFYLLYEQHVVASDAPKFRESQGRAAPGKNRGRRQVDKSVDQGYSVGHGRQGASRKANSRERVGARLIR